MEVGVERREREKRGIKIIGVESISRSLLRSFHPFHYGEEWSVTRFDVKSIKSSRASSFFTFCDEISKGVISD